MCSQNSAADQVEVDSHVNMASSYKVVSVDGKALSTYMNWSDMKKNHNKFYVCQVLKEKGGSQRAWLYTRYGRVGVPGVKDLQLTSDEGAVKLYNKKVNEKLRKGYTEIKVVSAEKGPS